jgi:hypothetical protein
MPKKIRQNRNPVREIKIPPRMIVIRVNNTWVKGVESLKNFIEICFIIL